VRRRHPTGSTTGESVAPLAVGSEQQDGAVVDDDLDSDLVVLDPWCVVLDRVAGLTVAVGAVEVNEGDDIFGEVACLERDRGQVRRAPVDSFNGGSPSALDSGDD
jgi:hypothetical protein